MGCLKIVDRFRDAILERLSRHAANGGAKTPLRLLLLARSDGDWWRSLGSRPAIQSILDNTAAQELISIAPTKVEREEIFQEAVGTFASIFGVSASNAPTPPLDDPRFGRALYLHMAAMAMVLRVSFTASTLMDAILLHEETFWRRSSDPLAADIELRLARELVASATLLGGIPSRNHAHALTDRLLGRKRERAEEEVVALLHRVYSRSASPAHLPAMEPDLLGEEMILRATKDAHAEWIDQAVPSELCTTESTTTVFTVLGRIAARDNSSRVHAWIDQLLRRDLSMYAVPALRAAKAVTQQTTASPLGRILTRAVIERDDPPLARAIQEEQIPYPSISLSELGNWYLTVLLQDSTKVGSGVDATRERATLLLQQGRTLDALGRHSEAVAADQESLRLFQALHQASPDAYFSAVCLSMSNLVATAGRAKDQALSLKTAEALVALYLQRFGNSFHAEALVGFATALNNLANSLNETGDYSNALARAGDAATAWRLLVRDHPSVAEFRARFATTQFVISNSYWALGKVAEAATAAEESAVAFRSLYLSDKESYADRLGSTLISLGRAQRSQGLYHEAAGALKEAVIVYQSISPPIPPPILEYRDSAVSDFCETLAAWEQARPDLIERIRREYGWCARVHVHGNPSLIPPDPK
jgi:Tetratricopeptide repeat